MNELLPIIRRKRRPLIEQDSLPDRPPVATVVAPAAPTVPPVAEIVPTEPAKIEVTNDAAADN